jgi:hypothetical protein
MIGFSFEESPGVVDLLKSMGKGLSGVSLVQVCPTTEAICHRKRLVLKGGCICVQVPGSFFAVKPVLRVLQDMPSLPLAEELVHGQEPGPVTYLPPETVTQVCGIQQHDVLLLATML